MTRLSQIEKSSNRREHINFIMWSRVYKWKVMHQVLSYTDEEVDYPLDEHENSSVSCWVTIG